MGWVQGSGLKCLILLFFLLYFFLFRLSHYVNWLWATKRKLQNWCNFFCNYFIRSNYWRSPWFLKIIDWKYALAKRSTVILESRRKVRILRSEENGLEIWWDIYRQSCIFSCSHICFVALEFDDLHLRFITMLQEMDLSPPMDFTSANGLAVFSSRRFLFERARRSCQACHRLMMMRKS